MDRKTLHTLEYHKILEKLAGYTSFSGSADLARAILPTIDIETARHLQRETTEARSLLASRPSTSIGGVRDLRPEVAGAARGVILDPATVLEVKHSLVSAREIHRVFERLGENYPKLTLIALRAPVPPGLIDVISRIISDRGEILDSASPRLGQIRHDMRIVHDRLLTKMQKMLTDPKVAPYLQDNLITMRDGRYVIPLISDHKGKIKAVVHDQSASGATLFVEPLTVVEQNNQYRQLLLDERDEERRIMAALSQQIGSYRYELDAIIEAIAELDLAFARAKYAEDLMAVEPIIRPISGSSSLHPGTHFKLEAARHPLLDPFTVVPIDVLLDERTYALIITGPNTGGKTVTLKTVGLMSLMAQSGLHIPAEQGSEISLFDDIYADIGDEQSIEQSLSTFSAHITNIVHILEMANPRSLVLLDELGSGTDPQEGAALAMAILTFLLDKGITTFVATHYPELKSYALSRPGAVNASVEFNVETLRPTYHLIIGLPGASNALTIASRLGLNPEIIQMARQGFTKEELHTENLITEIHQQRDLIRKAREHADHARHEAERLRHELSTKLESIEDDRRNILEKARKEAASRVQEVEDEIRELRRRLTQARQPLDVVEEVTEELEELEEAVVTPIERQIAAATEASGLPAFDFNRPIRLGDKVRLRSLGSQGVVSALSEEEAEVQIGVLRIRTRRGELELVGQSPAAGTPEPGGKTSSPRSTLPDLSAQKRKPLDASLLPSPGVELDIRGTRVEDALEKLETYLDNAYLANMPFVRIIHGKGTGRLREAVRKVLQNNPHIKSFEAGLKGEGDDGVTVVKFN